MNKILVGKLKERNYLRELSIDVSIILKWILSVRLWIGFIGISVVTDGFF
jgi:hypothetical protein